jgi:hypothetical protein
LDTSLQLWGLLFGAMGLGYVIYGGKQRSIVPMTCGLALMVFPYFVSNLILLVAVGLTLVALPFLKI